MTIRDEDLQRCASSARQQWLQTMPEAVPDHDFSHRFRRKVWLSRFRAYRLYYAAPVRKFLRGLGIWLLLNLLVLAIYPFEHRMSDTAFMREADRMVVRIDDDFAQMADIEASLLLPQTIPLAETDRTIEIDDLSAFPENAFTATVYGGMGDALNKQRLAVLFELDFYAGDTLLGTIQAVTPRDQASLADSEQISGWNLFADCGGHPVVFRRGSKYFCMFEVTDVLDGLLTGGTE